MTKRKSASGETPLTIGGVDVFDDVIPASSDGDGADDDGGNGRTDTARDSESTYSGSAGGSGTGGVAAGREYASIGRFGDDGGESSQSSKRTGSDSDADRFRNDPHRRGIRSRASSGSRSRANQERSATKESAPPDSGAIPREVGFTELGKTKSKSSIKDTELTVEFFREGWGLIFHGASMFMRDPEWKLPEDDAQELAERTQRWLGSLDARRLAQVQKRIAKIQPMLSLGMGLAAVVAPRVMHTRELRKKNAQSTPPKPTSQRIPPQQQQQHAATNGNGSTSPAASAGPHIPRPVAAERFGGDAGGARPVVAVERPITSDDWPEIFGEDNA